MFENEFLTQLHLNFTATDLNYTTISYLLLWPDHPLISTIIEGVCQQCSIPFIGVKSITDIVDNDKNLASVDEFEQNLAKASKRLQEKLTLILTLMAEQSLSKWSF